MGDERILAQGPGQAMVRRVGGARRGRIAGDRCPVHQAEGEVAPHPEQARGGGARSLGHGALRRLRQAGKGQGIARPDRFAFPPRPAVLAGLAQRRQVVGKVLFVAAEELVPALAVEEHGHVFLLGPFEDAPLGVLAGAADRQLVHPDEGLDLAEQVAGPGLDDVGDHVGLVHHLLGEPPLVVGAPREAAAEHVIGPVVPDQVAGDAHQGARTEAAGEARAHLDVAAQAQAHGIDQKLADALHRLLFAETGEVRIRGRRPVRRDLELERVGVQNQLLAAQELAHVGEHRRPLVVQPAPRLVEEAHHANVVGFVGDLGQGVERLVLGREGEEFAAPGEEQGLFGEAVAGEQHPAPGGVEQGEGEHAVEFPEHVVAPVEVALQKDLGVRARFEHGALGAQPRGKLHVVVDFAVEVDDRPALGIAHGLAAPRRRIEDGQAAVAKDDAAVQARPQPVAVRPAVDEALGHGLDRSRIHPRQAYDSGNSAHLG